MILCMHSISDFNVPCDDILHEHTHHDLIKCAWFAAPYMMLDSLWTLVKLLLFTSPRSKVLPSSLTLLLLVIHSVAFVWHKGWNCDYKGASLSSLVYRRTSTKDLRVFSEFEAVQNVGVKSLSYIVLEHRVAKNLPEGSVDDRATFMLDAWHSRLH